MGSGQLCGASLMSGGSLFFAEFLQEKELVRVGCVCIGWNPNFCKSYVTLSEGANYKCATISIVFRAFSI